MYIKIHRGSMQIGGSIIEMGTQNTKIIFDCGKNLPELNGSETNDNIDIDGLMSGKKQYDAVFVSHYHNDHCGHINRILPDIPVYMGAVTRKILNLIADFTNTAARKEVKIFHDGVPVCIGDGDMVVTPIAVKHSAADAYMFLISADGRYVLYTGDYKQADEIIPKLKAQMPADARIDVLITEGTNMAAERNGNPIQDEAALSVKGAEIMKQTDGDVFVLGSSTNIDRINAIMKACKYAGRTFAVDLFAACVLDAVEPHSVFSDDAIKKFVWFGIDKDKSPSIHKHLNANLSKLCSYKKLADVQKLCVYIRPTMLSFLENLSRLKSLAGSTLVYAFWSGYKEKADVAKLLSFCEEAGMNIVTLHVSGHATKAEIAKLITAINPIQIIPVHGENREAFGEISPNCIYLNDGEVFAIGNGS